MVRIRWGNGPEKGNNRLGKRSVKIVIGWNKVQENSNNWLRQRPGKW